MFTFDRFVKSGVTAALLSALILGAMAGDAISRQEAPDGNLPTRPAPGASYAPAPSDPRTPGQLLEPGQLASALSNPRSNKPLVLCIGPNTLYRSGHIPAAKRLGPAARPEGIASLQNQVQDLPRDTEIVLYCGCCPWEDCPNIRPAFSVVQKIGFTRVHILHLAHNFKQDWTDRGFPVQKGE